ncbi:MAG: hypothetical protein H6982_07900 [Chromatiales bacterium]|nr:hypothetical protein [Chromatiales bacterium]
MLSTSRCRAESRKEAPDDAISATKAAVRRVSCWAAGWPLLRGTEAIQARSRVDGDERTGMQIRRAPSTPPTRQIARTPPGVDGVVVARMLEGTGNLVRRAARKAEAALPAEAGITIRRRWCADWVLENAVSVASAVTEATMTEILSASFAVVPRSDGDVAPPTARGLVWGVTAVRKSRVRGYSGAPARCASGCAPDTPPAFVPKRALIGARPELGSRRRAALYSAERPMKLIADVGGTFTDLVYTDTDDDGRHP